MNAQTTSTQTSTINEMLDQLKALIDANYENIATHSELVTAFNHLVIAQDKLNRK